MKEKESGTAHHNSNRHMQALGNPLAPRSLQGGSAARSLGPEKDLRIATEHCRKRYFISLCAGSKFY